MAETLRELVVALSLDSSNFSRNMRTINQQIKEAESTFRLAGAGVENYEKTIAGTAAKLSILGQKLTQQQRAVEQYSRALVAANDKLKENYDRHQDYTQRLEQAKARQEDLRFEVQTATVAYENYRNSLGETDSATIAAKQNLERYQQEYEEATAENTKLDGQVKALQKTMQNSADAVSKAQTDPKQCQGWCAGNRSGNPETDGTAVPDAVRLDTGRRILDCHLQEMRDDLQGHDQGWEDPHKEHHNPGGGPGHRCCQGFH